MPYQGGEIKQKSPTIFTGRRACPFQDGCNRTKNSVFFDAKIVQKTQKSNAIPVFAEEHYFEVFRFLQPLAKRKEMDFNTYIH